MSRSEWFHKIFAAMTFVWDMSYTFINVWQFHDVFVTTQNVPNLCLHGIMFFIFFVLSIITWNNFIRIGKPNLSSDIINLRFTIASQNVELARLRNLVERDSLRGLQNEFNLENDADDYSDSVTQESLDLNSVKNGSEISPEITKTFEPSRNDRLITID